MNTIIKNLVVSDTEPQSTNYVWIKPTEGSFELYVFTNGKWVEDDKTTLTVGDIKTLTPDVIDVLNPGDIVNKVTGTATHSYRVSYKDATEGGMCITYADAENVETVAYEKHDGVWEYLDTTITNIGGVGEAIAQAQLSPLSFIAVVNEDADLPVNLTASDNGYTYIVGTAGEYASEDMLVGDYVIWTGTEWNFLHWPNE